MRSKLSVLTIFFLLFVSVYAWGDQKFGPNVETDTTYYPTIQNFFLSPFQLTDYNFLGGGARARGMGGAFLAISDDPSAASWNPAGLTQIDKPQMLLNFSSYRHHLDYTTSGLTANYENSSKLKRDNNSISFASVVIPFKIREKELVGSVLFQKLADIYQENKYVFILDNALTLNNDQSGYDTLSNYVMNQLNDKTTGSLNAVSVSCGGKIYKSLSLGLGVNIYGGNFITDDDFFYSTADSSMLGYPVVDTTGLNGDRFRPHIKSNYSGVNLTFGAMYKLNKLSLGGVVKTPFTLKEKNDLKIYTDVMEDGILLESSSILVSPFFYTDRKWKMPIMVGFGSSYKMNALTLSADIEYRGYSKTEVTYRGNIANPTGEEVTTGGYVTNKWWGKEGVTPPSVSILGWRNITQLRIGGEYILNTKYGKVPVRVGFRNDPEPYSSQTNPNEVYMRMIMDTSDPTDTVYTPKFIQSEFGTKQGSWINGKIISLGTGMEWTQIKLDITYEYATYPDVKDEITTARRRYYLGTTELVQPLERNSFSRQQTNNHYGRLMVSFTGMF